MPALTAEQVTIIRAGLDASAYQTGANIVVAANQQMAASGDPVTQTTTKMTAALSDGGGAAERYRRQIDTNYASIQKYAQIQDAMNRSVDAGRMSLSDANDTLALYAQKFGLVSAAAQEAQQRIVAATDAARALSNAQAAFNAKTGVTSGGNPLYGEDYAKRQADIDAYGNSLDALRAKYNPLFAVSKQYEATLADISNAEKVGAISAQEATAARDRATKSFADQTGTAKTLGLATADIGEKAKTAAGHLNTMEHGSAGVTRELLVMTHEAIMGRVANLGGSFLVLSERVAFLQKGIAGLASAAFNPLGIAIVGATAILGGFGIAAETEARRVEALRNSLSLVRDDYVAMSTAATAAARDLAKNSFLSTSEAQTGITKEAPK